jgi:FAD synthetase
VQESISHIRSVITQYGGLSAVSLCFNGGKDCTVLLHLLAFVLKKYYNNASINAIPIVYFKVDEEFDELYQFNLDMMKYYNFELIQFDGRDMKQCLSLMLLQFPSLRTIFMGQRRTDPNGGNLSLVQHSDIHNGWPAVDRANTILNWGFDQVWDFLIDFELPYCRLYELGFTSLGSLGTTIPNPYLLKKKTIFVPILEEELGLRTNQTGFCGNNNNNNNNDNNNNNHNHSNHNPTTIAKIESSDKSHSSHVKSANSAPLPTLTRELSLENVPCVECMAYQQHQLRQNNSNQITNAQNNSNIALNTQIPLLSAPIAEKTNSPISNIDNINDNLSTKNDQNFDNPQLSVSHSQSIPPVHLQDSLSYLTYQLQHYLDTEATIVNKYVESKIHQDLSTAASRPPIPPTTHQCTKSNPQPTLTSPPNSLSHHPTHHFHQFNTTPKLFEHSLMFNQHYSTNGSRQNGSDVSGANHITQSVQQDSNIYDVYFELYERTTENNDSRESNSNEGTCTGGTKKERIEFAPEAQTVQILNASRLHYKSRNAKPSYIDGIPYNANSATGIIMIRQQKQNCDSKNQYFFHSCQNDNNFEDKMKAIEQKSLFSHLQSSRQTTTTTTTTMTTPAQSLPTTFDSTYGSVATSPNHQTRSLCLSNHSSGNNSLLRLTEHQSNDFKFVPTTSNPHKNEPSGQNIPRPYASEQPHHIHILSPHAQLPASIPTSLSYGSNLGHNNDLNFGNSNFPQFQNTSSNDLDLLRQSVHYDLITINLSFWPYLPAYLLSNANLERDGRIKNFPIILTPKTPLPNSQPNQNYPTNNSTQSSLIPNQPLLTPESGKNIPPHYTNCKTCGVKRPLNPKLNSIPPSEGKSTRKDQNGDGKTNDNASGGGSGGGGNQSNPKKARPVCGLRVPFLYSRL